MSPKLKRGLIIGGAVVGGLCLLGVVVVILTSLAGMGGLGGAAAPSAPAYYYAEEAAVEAPADAEMGERGGYAGEHAQDR